MHMLILHKRYVSKVLKLLGLAICSHKIYIKTNVRFKRWKNHVIFANFRYNRPIKYKGVPYETDIEIAQSIELQPIVDVVKKIGLVDDDLELYGKYKAKLRL